MGYSSHGCRRLAGRRRARRIIHVTSTSSSGGQTQPSALSVLAPGARAMSPVAVMPIAAAGPPPQRWGRSVKRADSTASSAQPAAKPSSNPPVMTASPPPASGPATSATAAATPAISEPATTTAGRRRGGGSAAGAEDGVATSMGSGAAVRWLAASGERVDIGVPPLQVPYGGILRHRPLYPRGVSYTSAGGQIPNGSTDGSRLSAPPPRDQTDPAGRHRPNDPDSDTQDGLDQLTEAWRERLPAHAPPAGEGTPPRGGGGPP